MLLLLSDFAIFCCCYYCYNYFIGCETRWKKAEPWWKHCNAKVNYYFNNDNNNNNNGWNNLWNELKNNNKENLQLKSKLSLLFTNCSEKVESERDDYQKDFKIYKKVFLATGRWYYYYYYYLEI